MPGSVVAPQVRMKRWSDASSRACVQVGQRQARVLSW